MRRAVLFVVLVAAAVIAAGFLGTGKALAYGPHEVAQVEVSGNCDNATWCNANPVGMAFGTGGFWIWAALNSDNTVDASFAGCGHTVGGGGPGSAGAGGGPVDGTWTTAPDLFTAAFVDGAIPVGIQLNSDGSVNLAAHYYVITLPSPFGPFVFAVPVERGHYSYSGVQFISGVPSTQHIPGVNFQTQVAP